MRHSPQGPLTLAGAFLVALVVTGCLSEPDHVVARSTSVPTTTRSAAEAMPAPTSTVPGTRATTTPLGPVTVLVVGDSVADGAAQSMAAVARDFGAAVVNRAVWGCGIVQGGPFRYFGALTMQPPQCDDWPTRWVQAVQSSGPQVAVLMVGRWELMDRVVGGSWSHIGEAPFDAYLRGKLDQAVEVLSARGAEVVITTAPYFRRGLRPDGGLYPEDEPERVDRYNSIVREVAARHPGRVAVVDLGARLTPDGFTRVVDGTTVRGEDGVHLSPEGGR